MAPHLKLWCFARIGPAPGLGLAAGLRQAHRMPRTKSIADLKQELSFYKKLNPYYYLESTYLDKDGQQHQQIIGPCEIYHGTRKGIKRFKFLFYKNGELKKRIYTKSKVAETYSEGKSDRTFVISKRPFSVHNTWNLTEKGLVKRTSILLASAVHL